MTDEPLIVVVKAVGTSGTLAVKITTKEEF